MTNPYKVLEVSPSASDEEIKRAYRVLSRKYHLDANVNNPDKKQAEERFKEIQQAYHRIVEERERGSAYGSGKYTGFADFSEEGFQRESDSEEYQMHLHAAVNYIQNSYFSEAIYVLQQLEDRTGAWYFLSAIANAGLGNHVMAMEHARTAVLLEPNNMQYRQFLAQLEAGRNWYQGMQGNYRANGMVVGDYCIKTCFACGLCELCMDGGCFCGTWYGPYCC